jgi:hypothetical protein
MATEQSPWLYFAAALAGLALTRWLAVKVIERFRVRGGPLGDQDDFAGDLKRWDPEEERAARHQATRLIYQALTKRLGLSPELATEEDLRSLLLSYGVSRESVDMLAQLMEYEKARDGGSLSSDSEPPVSLRQVREISKELQERLPKTWG